MVKCAILAPTYAASNFFTFLFVSWTASNCLAALFRLIAFASPSSESTFCLSALAACAPVLV